jgi:hypothetical protein
LGPIPGFLFFSALVTMQEPPIVATPYSVPTN